ncbi:MAG: hypothetical protein ACOYMN_02035 [Roseimicrobium sp.]
MRRISLGFLLLCCLGITACDWDEIAAKKLRQKPAPEKGIVWIKLNGGELAVPNKTQEEWGIRSAILKHALFSDSDPTMSPNAIYYVEVTRNAEIQGAWQARARDAAGRLLPATPPPLPPIRIEPPKEFLQQFMDLKPVVRAASEANYRPGQNRATDKVTGLPGHLFTIGPIGWLRVSEVEVTARGLLYRLTKTGEQWAVTRTEKEPTRKQ